MSYTRLGILLERYNGSKRRGIYRMKKLSMILVLVLAFSVLAIQTPGVKANDLNYWVKSYGGSGDDVIKDVKVLPGGSIIAVGYTTSFGAGGMMYS